MKVGILGAGHAGLALYTLMKFEGQNEYDPILYASPSHLGTLKAVFSSPAGLPYFDGKTNTGFSLLSADLRITHDVADIIEHADVLVSTLPINAHIPFFDQALEAAQKTGKTIPLVNLSGGFAIFDHISKQRQADCALIPIASAHTLPYAARVTSDTGIAILNRRSSTLISVDAAEGLSSVVQNLASFMKTPLTQNPNHLYCAIDRSSYVLHPIITALNFNKIERQEPFFFYKDGLTSTAYNFLVAAGHERRAVCESLGFRDFVSPEDRMKNFVTTYMEDFAEIRPPASANHRFFKEDIPYGLVFLRTLGQMQGIDMPVCDAVITMSSIICNTNFREHSPFDLTKNPALADLVMEYSASTILQSPNEHAAQLSDASRHAQEFVASTLKIASCAPDEETALRNDAQKHRSALDEMVSNGLISQTDKDDLLREASENAQAQTNHVKRGR